MVQRVPRRNQGFSECLVGLRDIIVVIYVYNSGARCALLCVAHEAWANRDVVPCPDVVGRLGRDNRDGAFRLEGCDGVLDVEWESVDQDRCSASTSEVQQKQSINNN
jgi:hypothetical protein